MTADLFRGLAQGHHRLACPECAVAKHRRCDTALSVDIDAAGGAYLCHRCGWCGGWKSGSVARPVFAETPRQHLSLATHWRDLWRSLGPIAPNTTAHSYLIARGCAIPPSDGDLRCTESLRHPSGYTGPALIALVTDAITSESLTLHRTWIRADGRKADIELPRMLLGKHRKQGGVIRLFPDEAVTTGLAIAEGVETALSVATVFRPVWSCIDAGNLAAFAVLPGIESLLIAADNDPAGLRAADECATNWWRAGREVRIAKSPVLGEDLNEYARRAA